MVLVVGYELGQLRVQASLKVLVKAVGYCIIIIHNLGLILHSQGYQSPSLGFRKKSEFSF